MSNLDVNVTEDVHNRRLTIVVDGYSGGVCADEGTILELRKSLKAQSEIAETTREQLAEQQNIILQNENTINALRKEIHQFSESRYVWAQTERRLVHELNAAHTSMNIIEENQKKNITEAIAWMTAEHKDNNLKNENTIHTLQNNNQRLFESKRENETNMNQQLKMARKNYEEMELCYTTSQSRHIALMDDINRKLTAAHAKVSKSEQVMIMWEGHQSQTMQLLQERDNANQQLDESKRVIRSLREQLDQKRDTYATTIADKVTLALANGNEIHDVYERLNESNKIVWDLESQVKTMQPVYDEALAISATRLLQTHNARVGHAGEEWIATRLETLFGKYGHVRRCREEKKKGGDIQVKWTMNLGQQCDQEVLMTIESKSTEVGATLRDDSIVQALEQIKVSKAASGLLACVGPLTGGRSIIVDYEKRLVIIGNCRDTDQLCAGFLTAMMLAMRHVATNPSFGETNGNIMAVDVPKVKELFTSLGNCFGDLKEPIRNIIIIGDTLKKQQDIHIRNMTKTLLSIPVHTKQSLLSRDFSKSFGTGARSSSSLMKAVRGDNKTTKKRKVGQKLDFEVVD
jgi:hypothetical protein